MKFVYITFLFIIVSCEQPRTNRPNYGSRDRLNGTTIIYQDLPQSSSSTTAGVSEQSLNSGSEQSSDDKTSNDASSSTSLIGISADNQSCNWTSDGGTYEFNNQIIGDYNFCKSSTFSNNFYLQVKAPTTSDLCFFPMYNSGQSTHYLGNASCVRALASNQIYQVELYKNRSGFTSFPINELLVVKNQSYTFPAPYPVGYPIPAPDAFKQCMDYAYYYYTIYQISDDSYCEAFSSQGIHAKISF